jgi:hypothetical protein
MDDKIIIHRLIIVPFKGWKSSSIGEELKRIKIPFRKIQEIEVRKCLLSFGGESCVFKFAVQKYND